MKTIHPTIFINAPREKVWKAMLEDATYREWTNVFMEGSHYQGNLETGSKVLFLAPDKEGKSEGGMVSRVLESRPYEFFSLEHLGMVQDGVEDTTSELVQKWAGAKENYTFNEKDGGTEVIVNTDIDESDGGYMENAWKAGLEKLKEIAER